MNERLQMTVIDNSLNGLNAFLRKIPAEDVVSVTSHVKPHYKSRGDNYVENHVEWHVLYKVEEKYL